MSGLLVANEWETLQEIIAGKSIARFGDGECRLMEGGGCVSQIADPALRDELRNIMRSKDRDRCIVGIPTFDKAGPKNVKFFRLAHGLGNLIRQNIDGFDKGDSHDALKKLQGDSGVMCESEVFDLPGLGKITRQVPRSLSFDEMQEDEFRLFWDGICKYLIETYWHDLTPDQIAAMAELLPQRVA